MTRTSKKSWLPQERLLVALLFAVTFFFIPGAGSPFVLPKFFILLIGALLLSAFAISYQRIEFDQKTKIVYFALTFFWLGFLWASLSSHTVYSALLGEYNRMNGLAMYTALILIVFSVSNLFTIISINRLLNSIIVCAVLVSGYGFIQKAGLDPINWVTTSSSFISFLGNSNYVSAYLGIASVVAFLQIILNRNESKKTLSYLVVTVFLLISTVSSGSQQGLFAFAGGTLVISLTAVYQKKRTLFYSGLLLGIIGGIATIFGLLGSGPISIFLKQRTLAYRGDYMWTGWNMALLLCRHALFAPFSSCK